MLTALSLVLAHNTIYTYIAPFLAAADMTARIDRVLLLFDVALLLDIGDVGVLIDRYLCLFSLACSDLFTRALLVAVHPPAVVYAAVAL